ncbi:hypothetical protein GCM10027578_16920 [Spirosoma luteolum]
MTPLQRQELIAKYRQGTLTDDEMRQVQHLLQSDPAFYTDLMLEQTLAEAAWEEAGRVAWKTVGHGPLQSRQPVRPVWRSYALAACLTLLLAGVWLVWWLRQTPASSVLKVKKQDVFLLVGRDDRTRLGYDNYAGSIWLIWQQTNRPAGKTAYRFCQDTLRIYLRAAQDTVAWRATVFRFDPNQQRLYLAQPGKPLFPLLECADEPQPIVP